MRKATVFIVLALLLILCATPAYANGILKKPHAFYGSVTINGVPAPVGTSVEARGTGVLTGIEDNPTITSATGIYGTSNPFEHRLIVQGDIQEGATLTFYVNGVSTGQIAAWHEGETTELPINLVSDVIAREVETVPAGTSSVTLSEAGTTVATVIVKTTGPVTVTVEEYASNPGAGFGGDTGKYIDVHIDHPERVTELEIRLYYTDAEIIALGLDEASLKLRWWNATTSSWVDCSPDSGVNTTDNYIWAKIRAAGTIPTLADLTGTPFGAGGTAAAAPAGGGGGGGGAIFLPYLTGLEAVPRLEVDADGIIQATCRLKTVDGKLTLNIARGTKLLDSRGDALRFLSAVLEPSPPAPPSGGAIILAYNLGLNGATFSPAVTLTIEYGPLTLPEDVAEKDLYIAYWDGSKWLALKSTVDTKAHTISCGLTHFTIFAIIASPAPPALATFSVSKLSIQPAEVQPKEAVTIAISVANTGGTEGSYSVVLKINGVKEAEQSITVAPGSSQSVSFSVTKEEAGSYNITVDGLSGSFTVVAPSPAPPPEAKPPISWTLIGIIAGVVIVGVLIFLLARRRA